MQHIQAHIEMNNWFPEAYPDWQYGFQDDRQPVDVDQPCTPFPIDKRITPPLSMPLLNPAGNSAGTIAYGVKAFSCRCHHHPPLMGPRTYMKTSY